MACIGKGPAFADQRNRKAETEENSMPRPICPHCSRDYTCRASRSGLKERLLSIIYVYPFRCQLCGYRFPIMQWGARYFRIEEDRREYERLPITFPISFTGEGADGTGLALDISINGCSLQANSAVDEGDILGVTLHTSRDLPPIQIQAAVVRTVQGDRVGLEFLRFEFKERERLQLFVRSLLNHTRLH